jgi:hypothetical protein
MSRLARIVLSGVFLFSLAGCYEMDVQEAVSKLKIGMTKAELDKAFKKVTLIKVRTVNIRPGITEEQSRAISSSQGFEEVHPEDLVTKQLVFDGNTKVYSYLVKTVKKFANPDRTTYIAVFVDQKTDRVIGWGILEDIMNPKDWDEFF